MHKSRQKYSLILNNLNEMHKNFQNFVFNMENNPNFAGNKNKTFKILKKR